MAPKPNNWYLHKRQEEIQDTQEKRRMWKWTQKFWWHIYKRRSTKDYLWPPEARTEPWDGFSSPQASKGTNAANNLISDFRFPEPWETVWSLPVCCDSPGKLTLFSVTIPQPGYWSTWDPVLELPNRPQSPYNTPSQLAAINFPKLSTNLWLNTVSVSSKKHTDSYPVKLSWIFLLLNYTNLQKPWRRAHR